MTSPLDALLDFGVDILSTTLDKATGRILAYLGDVKAKRSESDAAQFMQHVGMATRPRKAEPGKGAAQCVRICRSNGDVVIASSDSRTQEMYGQLDDGESAFFASDGQARALFKKDGSVNLYTRAGNTAGGAGMVIQLDAAGNTARVLNGAGIGAVFDGTSATITAGDGAAITANADGTMHVVGTGAVQIDGGSVVLGSSPALNPITNQVALNPTALVNFLTLFVTAVGTITSVTPGATAIATISPLLAPLLVALGSQKVTAE